MALSHVLEKISLLGLYPDQQLIQDLNCQLVLVRMHQTNRFVQLHFVLLIIREHVHGTFSHLL